MLAFPEYRPDVTPHQSQFSDSISNVVPRGDGYGPVKALVAFTNALEAACRGVFFARKNDGTISVFAGTSNKLYNLNNTSGAWTDVSKVGVASLLLVDGTSFLTLVDGTSFLDLTTGTGEGTYPVISASAQWQFAQFNNYVFALHQGVPPQVFDLTSSTAFADLGGSPPQAAYISVVNRFLVLSGIIAPNVYRVQWSGLNATTTWDGTAQSDSQDLADGGIVRGVAGGESGLIFQDGSIRRMTYAPGAPYVFSIERISQDDGLFAPYSLIAAGDRIFFCSPQGFKMMVPGGYPTPIGKERVDRSFFNDVDTGNLQLVIGAADPRSTRVYWVYKSVNGQEGKFDTILVYDWSLDRWSKISMTGEYVVSLSRPGITLEGVDAAYGSNIDTITVSSLDNISNASIAEISSVDGEHTLGFLTGSNLEATLETQEQGGGDRRIFVRGFRPVTDAGTVYGSVSARETAQATASYSTESLVNSVGICPQRVSTRYGRAKVRIPAATSWTYASGVEPDVVTEGAR